MGIHAIEDYEAFVDEARKLVGTPFHWGGRVPGYGIDCVGLVIMSAQNAGFEFEDKIDYQQRAKKIVLRHFAQALSEVTAWVPIEDMEIHGGDILSMTSYKGIVRHLGIYTFDDTIIHAHTEANKVVEQPFSHLEKYVRSVYRLKGFS